MRTNYSTNPQTLAACAGLLVGAGALFAAGYLYAKHRFTTNQQAARDILPDVLDASKIPHGDLAVPSRIVHSRRHIISQWQRGAAGATVVVLGHDKDGDLCIALGSQRGSLVQPQGYMEQRLPNDDLTGLRAKGASRLNGTTGDIVLADATMLACAAREVREEIGLDIPEDQLKILSISNGNQVVHTIAANYGTLLPNTPALKTLDHEFANDDMANPAWYKLKDIQLRFGKFYVTGSKLPINDSSIQQIQQAIQELPGVTAEDKAACKALLSFEASVGKER